MCIHSPLPATGFAGPIAAEMQPRTHDETLSNPHVNLIEHMVAACKNSHTRWRALSLARSLSSQTLTSKRAKHADDWHGLRLAINNRRELKVVEVDDSIVFPDPLQLPHTQSDDGSSIQTHLDHRNEQASRSEYLSHLFPPHLPPLLLSLSGRLPAPSSSLLLFHFSSLSMT